VARLKACPDTDHSSHTAPLLQISAH